MILTQAGELIAQAGELIVRDETITVRDATIERLTRRAELLQEQLNLAIARRYAARSEKSHPGQGQLFDEAECAACFPEIPDGMTAVAGDEAADTTVVPATPARSPAAGPCLRPSRGLRSSTRSPRPCASAPMTGR
ncbi:MAG TPA: transposase [Acidiferrobacter sp.]|nr:transposase [Acidiferrobacter sp.]